MDTRTLIGTVIRRRAWLLRRLDARKLLNLAAATRDFLLKRETVRSLPSIVKIDISPLCNLRCTVCVHASSDGDLALAAQVFDPKHKMSLEHFSRLIDQLEGRTTAVSLYYLGDPLVHPDLDAMCRVAADAGLQVHISTNLSFGLRDERIRSLVESGLSHLTVCVDGLSQEKYQRTRVGGNIARVLDNLKRICHHREAIGSKLPRIEAQYIRYQHNADEEEAARRLCAELGVDEFDSFWGALDNWTGREPENYDVLAPRPSGRKPLCYWPHFSTVVKYNGDLIPCCTFRQGVQYVPNADARVFGNVFEQGLERIWNSPAYQQARRLVSNPSRADAEPELREHFCFACPELYVTTFSGTTLWANQVKFEEVYDLDERGKPRRRDRRAP
jgi:MoaA/NifB/PqqE/SkfB family radical SAM enzyme